MKKYIALFLIGVAAVLVITYTQFMKDGLIITISEDQLTESISKHFPIQKKYAAIAEIELKNPRIVLADGSNRITGQIDVGFRLPLEKSSNMLNGTISISGGLKYVSETHEFYLINPVLEHLDIQRIPEKQTDKAAKAITMVFTDFWAKRPIYTLHSSNGKELVAKYVLRNVSVENKELKVTLGF